MPDSLRDYFNEVGRYPLLTVTQEIQLARQIEAGAALSGKTELTAYEKRVLRLAERAKRKLINCNLRLVVNVAKQYTRRLTGSGMELMDLIQEGGLGLVRAVELFDSSRGYKFSTYAYWWIKQAISRAIDSKERLVRVPIYQLNKVYKAVRYQRTHMQQEGKMPTLAQMAAEVETDAEDMQLLLKCNMNHFSLDALVMDNGSSALERMPDEAALEAHQDGIESNEKAVLYKAAIECLTPTELQLVQRRYGLTGAEPMSMYAIAAEEGVSRERVRQRLKHAHMKMRERLHAMRLV